MLTRSGLSRCVLYILVSGYATTGMCAAPPAFNTLIQCRDIASDTQRLACYDKHIAAVAAAESNGDIVVVDRAQIRQSKRALFGFGVIRLPLFGDHDDSTVPNEIQAKITGLRDLGYGKWEYRLDDGSRWREVEPSSSFPRNGQTVTIRVAALGSYFLKIGRGRAVKAIRVE